MPATIEFLPAGGFIISFEDGRKIQGKFGTWCLRRLELKKGFTDAQLYEAFTSRLIDILPDYILFAVEAQFRSLRTKESFPYDDLDACNWIDEMGGMSSPILIQLCNYASESIAGQKKSETPKEP